jgi:hypothetical protein
MLFPRSANGKRQRLLDWDHERSIAKVMGGATVRDGALPPHQASL